MQIKAIASVFGTFTQNVHSGSLPIVQYLLGILASYDPYTNVYYSFPYLWEGIASYDQRQQFVLESAIVSGYV